MKKEHQVSSSVVVYIPYPARKRTKLQLLAALVKLTILMVWKSRPVKAVRGLGYRWSQVLRVFYLWFFNQNRVYASGNWTAKKFVMILVTGFGLVISLFYHPETHGYVFYGLVLFHVVNLVGPKVRKAVADKPQKRKEKLLSRTNDLTLYLDSSRKGVGRSE